MNIDKSKLKQFWYEDEQGNELPYDMYNEPVEGPKGAYTYVTRFPLEIRTEYRKIIKQEEVDNCPHKRKWIKRTGGWKKGIVGRKCLNCGGNQVKKKYRPWGHKWNANGNRHLYTFNTHIGGGNSDIILAMANSGDYTLAEAILAYSMACERCSNALAYKYLNGADGYEEYSEEWIMCGTECSFCKDDPKNEEYNKIREEKILSKCKESNKPCTMEIHSVDCECTLPKKEE